ncbi:hypothetical protein MKY88_13040 [Lysinibacillus sp. FSL R7-0073]|uniref:hypothetical protein n=1 Tax=Lysinibacillus sp. FSL R7-0073 TaxID=2921669 RepID=UPI0030F96507
MSNIFIPQHFVHTLKDEDLVTKLNEYFFIALMGVLIKDHCVQKRKSSLEGTFSRL